MIVTSVAQAVGAASMKIDSVAVSALLPPVSGVVPLNSAAVKPSSPEPIRADEQETEIWVMPVGIATIAMSAKC